MMASVSGGHTPGEMSHIKEVFRTILQQHVQLDGELLAELMEKKLLTEDEGEEIALKQAKCSNHAEIMCLLFDKFQPSSDIQFVKCLERSTDTSNRVLASYILEEEPTPALSEQHLRFCKVFEAKLPELILMLKPRDLLDKLRCHLSQKEVEAIEATDREERSVKSKTALHLCLSLLRCESDWPSAFVDVLEKDSYNLGIYQELKKNLPIRNAHQLHASTSEDSDSFTICQMSHNARNQKETTPGDENDAPLLEREELMPETSKKETMGTAAHIPNEDAAGSDTPEGDNAKDFSSDFHKRLWTFQRKMAEPALKKQNTLLVSPTGTGKTYVAAFIIHYHLNELEAKKVKGKVVFIVPTVKLAKQQQKKLEEIIGSEKRIIRFAVGQNIDGKCSLLSIMTAEDVYVTVMTAEVLLNGMQKASIAGNVNLEDITLLIFDECHHTTKEHPYNKIMKIYLKKHTVTQEGDVALPQVIGMTANLGTGGSNSDEQAENHVFQVAASLDASVIKVVPVDDDLIKYLNIPEDVAPIILKPRQKDPFRDVLENVMEKIEEKIASWFDELEFGGISVTSNARRDTQHYETWIAEFQKICTESRNNMSEEKHQTVIICLENLKIYNKALCIHRDVRPISAVTYLEKEITSGLEHRTGECYEDLLKLFGGSIDRLKASISETEENPLLKTIREILMANYKGNPDCRTILFTRTRPYTKALQEWLKEDEELQELNLNPGRIFGSQSREISKSEGDETIENFRLGVHKLLVSTSVLEEGIDVKDCKLILRHNYVPSETGHTQVKGRGRAKGSKSYLVALTDTGCDFRDQEMNNKTREQWSESLLQKISNMSPQLVQQRIKDQQTHILKAMWHGHQRKESHGKADPQKFHLKCSQCPQKICLGSNIVCFSESMYVVTDSRIIDVCKIKRNREPHEIKENELINGKIYCKNCGNHWGSWGTINEQNYPMIKIKQTDVVNIETGKADHFTQWKKVKELFKIRETDTLELTYDIANATCTRE